MKDSERCPECGSWEAECANDEPKRDCRCSRCASVYIRTLEAALRRLDEAADKASSSGDLMTLALVGAVRQEVARVLEGK